MCIVHNILFTKTLTMKQEKREEKKFKVRPRSPVTGYSLIEIYCTQRQIVDTPNCKVSPFTLYLRLFYHFSLFVVKINLKKKKLF